MFLKGVAKIGLTHDDIEHLGKEGTKVLKCSRRDLAFAMAKGLDGACTVCATMQLAASVGISVFATGGLGGVHRGAEKTWDVSADLREFSKSPVIVVCAGAKAILDLPKTMEYLETEGVPVVGYKTSDLPAFYSSTSGLKLEMQLNTAKEIAEMHFVNKHILKSSHGMIVTNPIDKDKEVPHEIIDGVIEKAISEAEDKGISGKRSTPFLLAKICELTEGKSLASNIALVENNVLLATEIAKELNTIERRGTLGAKLKED
ncbi:putative Pseudouridine 5'-phosphate glycosidase [Monocercomonoides exilis]|uniref:putative Pseudouridine 5'-phosphate glycosidase n=1 Tax=Monocercomonoides exilis TaxID=2049356 RepID=UPI00355AB88E|nr:putative Pseudouridine 5'-phosphate glycosidase [Monocercomonoides exilis]|eukprot:MONOS_8073.1-p1 / transcript=MONOS_8073.1 / gene=MONOS_8073 / organism=Monocercomonoides_exilis_PA203 / gene_product=Pseudouridine 5'-phosphate glycosidase / transcript_product=Pseudouridine 5'-phosphate glycosidase / location=Mono_scaffold00294:66326-67197(-) / protein_length=259 / sequence_SO=supercontig / SO=protein_coding / is_pseudo=false